jgi:anti-sigma factor RsiW
MTLSLQDELLLNAYLDGELDPIEAARFEQRLVVDAALNAQVETLRALRRALRSDLAEDVPSPELRRRITRNLNLAPRAEKLMARFGRLVLDRRRTRRRHEYRCAKLSYRR